FNRIKIEKPFDFMIAPVVRFHDPEAYRGSKLAVDAATKDADGASRIHGLRPTPIGSLSVGLVVDSRDNEFFPRRGMYHEIGTRFTQGLPVDGDVRSGASGAILRNYFPLPG